MSETEDLKKALVEFRDERNWSQFHNTKNLALALFIEAGELNELFLWKSRKEAEEVDIAKLREELADVFAYALLIAEKHELDVSEIVLEKIKLNALKYPIDKSKGSARKYNEL